MNDILKFTKLFDREEMLKRLCPFPGHGSRDRLIHENGTLFTGFLIPKYGIDAGKRLPVTARFGMVNKHFSLFGWGITFKNREEPAIQDTSTKNDGGDLLLLGDSKAVNTLFFNDVTLVKQMGIKYILMLPFLIAVLERTGKHVEFARIPYAILGIREKNMIVRMKYMGNGVNFGYTANDESDIDLNSKSIWSLENVDNEDEIARIELLPTDPIRTGNELLFKHDLIDIKYGGNICGIVFNFVKNVFKQSVRYISQQIF